MPKVKLLALEESNKFQRYFKIKFSNVPLSPYTYPQEYKCQLCHYGTLQ